MALASKEYWDERYKQDPQPFDWYQRYKSNETFKAMLTHHLEKTSHALIVGWVHHDYQKSYSPTNSRTCKTLTSPLL